MNEFDLFVIGAGSAGVRASRLAAGMGKKVAVAEANYYGGTCVNVGCVPKKLFVYASEYPHMVQEAKGYGLDLKLEAFDWPTLRDNKTKEIERLNGIYQSLLDNAGVTSIWGHAKVIDKNTVEVGDKRYTADKILLATGGWPILPDIPGKEHCINSNQFFYLDNFPKSAVIFGSGYIAVEFAGILSNLGCKTTIASRSGKLMRGFDESTRLHAEKEILKGPLELAAQPSSVEKVGDQYRVTCNDGSVIDTDLVISAIGRAPNIENLGITELGIKLDDKGFVQVDEQYQTNVPSIFALGDLIDTPQLTPVALAEAMCFLRQQYKGDSAPMNYDAIATAVFCQPNLATVGLSEEDALKKGHSLQIFESEFRALKHTLTGMNQRSYMKLVVDKETDKVLGAHMVGEHAGEIMQGFAVAVKAGLTKAQWDETIGIHPTSAEEFVTMRTASR
ncbi:glutathione-disulfide reductase [Bermanella sp. R86510]|uniref:glutathione-disulfide reductase n=1 Tax=unclassified Bermanella TaxID=2627862 RepID=UPI0037C6A2BF